MPCVEDLDDNRWWRRRRQRLGPTAVIVIVLASQLNWPADFAQALNHYLLAAAVLAAVAWGWDVAVNIFQRVRRVARALVPSVVVVRRYGRWHVALVWG
jgi:hypothetical protein